MVAPCVSKLNRGLLERTKLSLYRRGSSASLTIDLGSSETTIIESTPIYENNTSEETGRRKLGSLTRHQLRHLDVAAALPTICAEFTMLPSPSTSSCEKVAGCSQKNRHTLWPIKETRVRLSSSYRVFSNSTDEDLCRSYINANYILDSDAKPIYIAAEGPMPNTMNDFWAMAFQQCTPVIVMITDLEEQSCGVGPAQKKCEKYWPESSGSYGKINVAVVSATFHDDIQVRHIVLKCDELEHHIKHIWFTKWLDHHLPVQHVNQLLKVILTMERYKAEYRQTFASAGPVVVHCSAGIGRTCTFIAIALGVEHIYKTPENIDIFAIVSTLRMQRFGAVQLPGQYVFIYLALQRMEKLLPEFTLPNDQNKIPYCHIPSEICDDDYSEAEIDSDNLLCNVSANLLYSNF